jgi:hypothetical protein
VAAAVITFSRVTKYTILKVPAAQRFLEIVDKRKLLLDGKFALESTNCAACSENANLIL